MGSQDVRTRSAITTSMPSVRNQEEVVKLTDVSRYIGRKACQATCSEWSELRDEVGHNHGTHDNPMDPATDSQTVMHFIEYENGVGDPEWLIRKDGCMYCAEPGCLKACPSLGTIVKYANGVTDFNQDKCIGCGYYITGCLFDIPWISQKDHKAYKYNLCSDRVSVGMEPACVKAYPTGAIVFGSKEDMKEHVAERIVDLKSHGYENTGLYDPERVGSTHVIYTLHHIDESSLYAGPTNQPSANPSVSLWKGVAKPLALLVMGIAILAGFSHYMRTDSDRTDDEKDHGQAETPVYQIDPSIHTFDPRGHH